MKPQQTPEHNGNGLCQAPHGALPGSQPLTYCSRCVTEAKAPGMPCPLAVPLCPSCPSTSTSTDPGCPSPEALLHQQRTCVTQADHSEVTAMYVNDVLFVS